MNKCSPLSFQILGGHNSTRALQSSPFQKYINLKISLKKSLKKKKKNLEKQTKNAEKNAILSVFNIRRMQFHQSSQVQPVSESRGGSTSVTDKRRTNEGNPRV